VRCSGRDTRCRDRRCATGRSWPGEFAASGAQGIASAPNANAKTNRLNAFINHVNAQRGQSLTNEQADQLIALATLL
jgi:hypothetical protein